MLALFYDTETTGLPLFHEPSEDPRQPHIVQLAAALVDLQTRQIVSSMDVIVYPDGWEIPAEVSELHGVTTEYARQVGIGETLALNMFLGLHCGRPRIAHNEQFDARIIRIALKRYPGLSDPEVWKGGASECTQRLSTPILKLPPTPKMLAAGRNHAKSANLGEAYKHFVGKELLGAHNALVDVHACIAVYFAIRDAQQVAA